jgi:hypothetical protein
MKAEVLLGVICKCECGHEFDGTVVTRLGKENMDVFVERVKRAGEDAARQVVEQINAALEESRKDELVGQVTSMIDQTAAEDQGDWTGVVGWEFHRTLCPKCKMPNLPGDRHYFYFICDNCGGKTEVAGKEERVDCRECGRRYEADYTLTR